MLIVRFYLFIFDFVGFFVFFSLRARILTEPGTILPTVQRLFFLGQRSQGAREFFRPLSLFFSRKKLEKRLKIGDLINQ